MRLFKIAANLKQYSRVEQSSIIKSLVAQNCKPSDIYRKIYDVYREACFSETIVTNVLEWVCHDEPLSKRRSVDGVETH